MANIVKFNMKQIPQALSEIFVRVTDLNRNELYAGVKPVSGEEIEINLGNSGAVGAGVIIQADTFNGSNLTEFKSLSGGALVSEILSNISLSGYKFQSNGTNNYIDLGFIPDENTDMAFQVTYLDSTGKQISGSDEFGLGSSNGNLISSVNGVESTFDDLGLESKSLGLLSSGLAYVDGLENGTEATVTGATLNLYAMAKNASSGDVEHCNAVWERISWYHNGQHHYIDFTEGSGSTVTDNFGNEYTIQGTVSDGQWINYEKARRVIIDSDMEGDCDDLAAMRVAAWAERVGYCDITALIISNYSEVQSLHGVCDAAMTFEGRSGLAIGINKLSDKIGGTSAYAESVLAYPHTISADTSEVEDALDTYRRALSQAYADNVKINIFAIGTLRALSDLLDAPADENYPSGLEMITRSVDCFYIMGGIYPSGREYNFTLNNTSGKEQVRAASQNFVNNCPVKLVFCGGRIGDAITTGGTLKTKYPTLGVDYVRDGYYAYGAENGRPSWDLISVYLGALQNPSQVGFGYVRGTNTVDSTGGNVFEESVDGNHYYVTRLKGQSYYQNPLNDIVNREPTVEPLGTPRELGRHSLARV